MRTLSGDEWAKHYEADIKTHGRLVVQGVPLEDVVMVNPLVKADVISDLDEVTEKGTFVVRALSGSNCLSPYLSTGAQIAGSPVFAEDRAVVWEIQHTRAGQPASSMAWRAVFAGIIDTVSVDPKAGTVTVNCRGKASALLATEIENITANADAIDQWGFPVTGGLLQDGIQYILDTGWGYAYGSPFPSAFVVVGGPPSDSFTDYWQDRTNLMQAIRDLGTGKNGWDLRYKWDLPGQGQDSFVLAYYLPDRLGAGLTIPILKSRTGADLVYQEITGLNLDITGVRNVAEVTPADDLRVPVISTNADSVARLGRRFLAVSEDLASHIDTPGEATDLGVLIVADAGTPKSAVDLLLPFTWCFELNDLFTVGSDGLTFDRTDLVFGVSHYELHYDRGKASTNLSGRQVGGAAAYQEWRRRGVNVKPTLVYVSDVEPVGPGKIGSVWYQRAV